MSTKIRCQAKDPSTCRFHGVPKSQIEMLKSGTKPADQLSESEKLLVGEPNYLKIFRLFRDVNEVVKEELCVSHTAENIETETEKRSGYTYKCERCGNTHGFTQEQYDTSTGGKVLSYLLRQLPAEHRNAQYVTPLASLQSLALNESFTRHYKNEQTKSAIETKIRRRATVSDVLPLLKTMKVPSSRNTDWTSYRGGIKEGEGLVYLEPEDVPKEILYKFSQCLRKRQHDTPEQAAASMAANHQEDKEVYHCPHCKKYHYGRAIQPNRTEEERYEFAKKTWSMPTYREAVSLVIKTYKLDKQTI